MNVAKLIDKRWVYFTVTVSAWPQPASSLLPNDDDINEGNERLVIS